MQTCSTCHVNEILKKLLLTYLEVRGEMESGRGFDLDSFMGFIKVSQKRQV